MGTGFSAVVTAADWLMMANISLGNRHCIRLRLEQTKPSMAVADVDKREGTTINESIAVSF